MNRRRLKCGGRTRRKALFGADGAIMAAATLAAAGMNVAATNAASKNQAKAITDSAKTQAQSIKDQTTNNTNLQKESISFTRQQNQENRQQQQDIQTTLQMIAGQSNVNDRMEASKVQLKLGGSSNKRSLKSTPFYGGADKPFKVTDGGGVIPIQVDPNGYGLYELYGNDHEHYHKAPGGKSKTGVGIKFADGSIVEGEGNQNSNQGELMYVTPQDAVFISKHSIDGFNPTEAVKNGVHPVEAFNVQEMIKARKGLNDDGSRKRRSLGGFNVLDPTNNITQLPSNNTGAVATGAAIAVKKGQTTSPVARYGTRHTLKNGGSRRKAAWGDYTGAIFNTAGNFLGAGITTIGNMVAARRLGKAYTEAGGIIADAYSQMKGIDLDEIKREDYEAPHTLAVIRDANTNINPQLERIRRNSEAERREINNGTMSSAARQQRLAGVNDRSLQRMSEQYSYRDNMNEQIKQGNAQRITEVAQANADRDVQARRDWGSQRLAVLQYNNDIENAKIAGIGQSRADALTQTANAKAIALQSSLGAIGGAIANSGQSFANAYDTARKERTDFSNTFVGLGDADQVTAAILRAEQTGDTSFVDSLDAKYRDATDEIGTAHFKKIQTWRNQTGNKSRFKSVPKAITTQVNRPTLGIPSLGFAGENVTSLKSRISLR